MTNTWDYRILYNGIEYWIGEVYYNEDGRPESYTEWPEQMADGYFDRLEDITTTVTQLSQALSQPPLRVNSAGVVGEIGVLK